MADKQITPFQLTDQFTMDNFNQRINETNIALQSKPNPNLLDNWYFANPVNQRGQTEYTGEVYTIDRWIAQWTGGGATLIEDGCVSIYRTDWESYLCQRISDDLGGQTVTFSALCKGNCGINLIECDSGWAFKSNIAGQGNTVIDDYTLLTVTGVVPQGCKNLLAELTSAQGVKSQFKAAKLELGSQQTLAHQENGSWVLNEIPDYGEQLARCQRYFWRSWTGDRNTHKSILGRAFGASTHRITGFSYPVEMRSKPTITIYGVTGRDKVTDYDSDVDYGDVAPVYWDTQRCMALSITRGVLTMDAYVYYFVEANAEL